MEEQPFLIVGVDIGITTAIAIFDLRNSLLHSEGKRIFSQPEIKKQILKFGKPLIIATDKERPPQAIAKLASSFNCKLFAPDHDLGVEEKDKIVKMYVKDPHEKDAIAAGICAYKYYAPQFTNIDKNLIPLGLSELSNRVKEMILTKKAKNISEAIKKLKPGEISYEKLPGKVSINWEKETNNLRRELVNKRKSYEILKLYSDKIEQKLKSIEKQKNQLLKEELKKNKQARKDIIKEKEMRARDILIRQLHFELEKQKSFSKAWEGKREREAEFREIMEQGYLPIIVIDNFSRDSIVQTHKDFGVSNQIVWIKNFRPSKNAAKNLVNFKPRVVIGVDEDTQEFLKNNGISCVNIQPQLRKYYAFISENELEKNLKDAEKRSFLYWLEEYKKR